MRPEGVPTREREGVAPALKHFFFFLVTETILDNRGCRPRVVPAKLNRGVKFGRFAVARPPALPCIRFKRDFELIGKHEAVP